MNDRVTILDCDFGDGQLEMTILEACGLNSAFANVPPREFGLPRDHQSVAVLTQYHPIDERFLEANPMLRAVVRYGVGLDVIDLEACRRRNILVRGVDDYCTDEVADHALSLMLALLRATAISDRAIKNGGWPVPRTLPSVRRIQGLTLGLVGVGRIAASVGTRATAFGVAVRGYDPHVSDETIRHRGANPCTLDSAMHSDVVSLHLPLNESTRHFVNAQRIARMKQGAVLINVARGGLIDEVALLSALETGKLAGAGLDVFQNEGRPSPLALHERVVATPHIGYYSDKSLKDLRVSAASIAVQLVEQQEKSAR